MPTDNKTGSNGRFSPDIYFDEAEHIYIVDGKNVPSVTEILAPLHRSYGKINPSVLEYAANRGKAVHEELQVYDLGGELEATPETAPYIQAYLEWEQVYRPQWLGVEQIVYHPEYGYIGTLDRAGILNGGKLAIVDIKTSQPTKEALVSLCAQTAAYEVAYLWQHDDLWRFTDPRKNQAYRFGLFLKADGTFRLVDCDEYEHKYGFDGRLLFKRLLDTYQVITKVLETKGKKNNG